VWGRSMDARRSIHLNCDRDDHAELTAKADRSDAVAISYVTPANDNVANQSQVTGTLPSFASSFSCRGITAILDLRHDMIRGCCAHPVGDHFLRRDAFSRFVATQRRLRVSVGSLLADAACVHVQVFIWKPHAPTSLNGWA
jgi:hypothetical protein